MTIAQYRAYFLAIMQSYSNYLGLSGTNIICDDGKVSLSVENSLTISFVPLDGYLGYNGLPIRRKAMILFTFVLEPKGTTTETQDSLILMANKIEKILDEIVSLRMSFSDYEFDVIPTNANSASGVVQIIVDYESAAPTLVANP